MPRIFIEEKIMDPMEPDSRTKTKEARPQRDTTRLHKKVNVIYREEQHCKGLDIKREVRDKKNKDAKVKKRETGIDRKQAQEINQEVCGRGIENLRDRYEENKDAQERWKLVQRHRRKVRSQRIRQHNDINMNRDKEKKRRNTQKYEENRTEGNKENYNKNGAEEKYGRYPQYCEDATEREKYRRRVNQRVARVQKN